MPDFRQRGDRPFRPERDPCEFASTEDAADSTAVAPRLLVGAGMVRQVAFTLNGKAVRPEVDDGRALLWVLRSDLGLTGTKFGCGSALCGACTVLVDDEAVRSCATRVGDVAGRKVVTIEGLAANGTLHPVQQAFVDRSAFQCGFCTPGLILASVALLHKKPQPTREEIVHELDGNLCRCGSHVRVLAAVQAAAKANAGAVKGGAR